RRPSAEILQSIAKALRVSAETLYVKAGILEERGEQDPVGVLLNDRTITERQRRLLIELYQSFHQENTQQPAEAVKPRRTAAAARARTTPKRTTKKKTTKPAARAKKRARPGR
ncbi:MAG: XRE family transcriptional regulator, partial [Actinomycetota bacterium]